MFKLLCRVIYNCCKNNESTVQGKFSTKYQSKYCNTYGISAGGKQQGYLAGKSCLQFNTLLNRKAAILQVSAFKSKRIKYNQDKAIDCNQTISGNSQAAN